MADPKVILKPGEDKDTQGNKGMYGVMPDKYNIIIVNNMEDEMADDEILQMKMD